MKKHKSTTNRPSFLFLNLCVVLASTALTFLFIEVAFRYKGYRDDAKGSYTIQDIGQVDTSPHSTTNTTLGHIIRMSKNSRIIYELIPNLSVKFMYKPITTNTQGFRGPIYDIFKNRKTVRIVGLGDSAMFGWGVKDDECYLALLSEHLNQSRPDYKWEIINTAVPGYNTVMEVETLKAKGLQYKPDIVIIHYVPNDQDLPNFIREAENYFSFRKSFFVKFIFSRFKGRYRNSNYGLVDAPRDPQRGGFENEPGRVPDQYKDMVGIDGYQKAMSELKSLSIEHDFLVIVFTHGSYPFIREIVKHLELDMVEASQAINEFMLKNNIEEYLGSPLTVSNKDPHHSAIGHAILARVLSDYLQNSGLLEKILESK